MGRRPKKLTKKELKEFKKILLNMRDNILSEIEHISKNTRETQKESAGDLSAYTLHIADVASDNFQRELSLELASNERELLFQIKEALERIEQGTYGICVMCKKPIPKTRLKAIPYTQLCKKCQEKREKESGF